MNQISLREYMHDERITIPLKIVTVYLLWKCFHHLAHLPGSIIYQLWAKLVLLLGNWYAIATGAVLSGLGMDNSIYNITIALTTNNRLLRVEEHCLAIPAMVVFAGSIAFFKGNWHNKVRFIVLGLIGIILINIFRLIFVCLAWCYLTPYYFNLHHSFIYAALTYGLIFIMIRFWILKAEQSVSTSVL